MSEISNLEDHLAANHFERRDSIHMLHCSNNPLDPHAGEGAQRLEQEGIPRSRASASFQPAPMPSQARPPDSTSRAVTVLARTPGWR